MNQRAKKTITGVTINYEDGSCDKLDSYAVVGFNDDTWFKVMLSPLKSADKISMNNLLVELSTSLIAYIDQEK